MESSLVVDEQFDDFTIPYRIPWTVHVVIVMTESTGGECLCTNKSDGKMTNSNELYVKCRMKETRYIECCVHFNARRLGSPKSPIFPRSIIAYQRVRTI